MAILDPAKNFAYATVLTGIAAGATSLTVSNTLGSRFPDPASGAYNLILWNKTDYANPSEDPSVEIVRATALSTDTFTITRAQEGTSDVAHNTVGKQYAVAMSWTKKMRDDVETGIQNTANYPRIIPSASGYTFVQSDDVNLYTANGANAVYLCYKGINRFVYRSGVLQVATATSFGSGTVSANTVNSIIVGSYIYVSFYDSTAALSKVYRILKTADISAASSWTPITLSGTNMTDSGTRLIGYDGTNLWFSDQTNLTFILGTISGTTITRNSTITVTGSNYTQWSRVDSRGIWANYSTNPNFKFASLSGVLDSSKIIYSGYIFLLNGKTYLTNTDNNLYLQDDL